MRHHPLLILKLLLFTYVPCLLFCLPFKYCSSWDSSIVILKDPFIYFTGQNGASPSYTSGLSQTTSLIGIAKKMYVDIIKIARSNINNLRYSDATTLMAESEE